MITRWTPGRKAGVLLEIERGEASAAAYGISLEELEEWRGLYAAHGLKGLRTTRLRNYRPRTSDNPAPGQPVPQLRRFE